jgi:hypothetical protein
MVHRAYPDALFFLHYQRKVFIRESADTRLPCFYHILELGLLDG